jgi:hypothetical protein
MTTGGGAGDPYPLTLDEIEPCQHGDGIMTIGD